MLILKMLIHKIDLNRAVWKIRMQKMKKANQPHIVSLTMQAILVVKEIKLLTNRRRCVFSVLEQEVDQ